MAAQLRTMVDRCGCVVRVAELAFYVLGGTALLATVLGLLVVFVETVTAHGFGTQHMRLRCHYYFFGFLVCVLVVVAATIVILTVTCVAPRYRDLIMITVAAMMVPLLLEFFSRLHRDMATLPTFRCI